MSRYTHLISAFLSTVLVALTATAATSETLVARHADTEISVPLPSGYCGLSRDSRLGQHLYPRMDQVMHSNSRSLSIFMDCEEQQRVLSGKPVSSIMLGMVGFGVDQRTDRVVRNLVLDGDAYYQQVADGLTQEAVEREVGKVNRNTEKTDLGTSLEDVSFEILDRSNGLMFYRILELIGVDGQIKRRRAVAGRRLIEGYDVIFMVNDQEELRDWTKVLEEVRGMTGGATVTSP